MKTYKNLIKTYETKRVEGDQQQAEPSRPSVLAICGSNTFSTNYPSMDPLKIIISINDHDLINNVDRTTGKDDFLEIVGEMYDQLHQSFSDVF